MSAVLSYEKRQLALVVAVFKSLIRFGDKLKKRIAEMVRPLA